MTALTVRVTAVLDSARGYAEWNGFSAAHALIGVVLPVVRGGARDALLAWQAAVAACAATGKDEALAEAAWALEATTWRALTDAIAAQEAAP